MAIGANGGTVAVQLELFGLKETETKLKRFERQLKNTFEKGKRAAVSFGNKMGSSLRKIRAAMQNTFANAAVGAGLFAVFIDGTRKALKLERVMLSLNKTLGANSIRAFDFATKAAKKYGLGLTATVNSFSKFTAAATAANIPLKTQEELFDAVTKSAVTFGMTGQEIDGTFQALQQMASKGVVSMEELRQQLGERVPIATAAAAKGFGVTTAELIEMVESGKLAASDFFPALTKGLNSFSSGEIETLSVQIGRLQNVWEELLVSLGQDFAVPMLERTVSWLGKNIEKLKEFGKRWKISGALMDVGGGGIYGNEQAVVSQQISSLEAAFGQYGLTQDKAIEAYRQALAEGNKIGSVAAAKRSSDIAKAMTDATREQQDAQQDGIKNAQAIEKVAKATAEIKKKGEKWATKENEKREQNTLKFIERQIGAEAASAVAADRAAKKAAQELAKARKGVNAAYDGDLTTNDGRVNALKANAEYQRATAENMRIAAESSNAIQEAFVNAKEAAKEAADAVGKAKESYGAFLTDPSKGIGKYLSKDANRRRNDAGRSLLVGRAREIRKSILPTLAGRDQSTFKAKTNFDSFSVGQLKEFITNAGGELEAQRALTQANQDLTKANHELSEVMKIAANNQVPLNESNAVLTQTINELINKDWLVNVEVPGGSASGDVVALQNSLQ